MVAGLVETTERIREEHFSGAEVVLLAGSIVRGEATAFSDLDLVVLYEKVECAYRKSFRAGGYPVEAFVHDEATLRYFMLEMDRPSGIPSLPQMVVEGIEVPRSTSLSRRMKDLARSVLEAGPPLLTEEELNRARYTITDLLDDLRAPRSHAELIAAGAQIYERLADFFFRANRRWSARGKAIPRRLKQVDERLGAELDHGFAEMFSKGDAGPVIDLAKRILAPYGGLLFEGYRSEAPREWRREPAGPGGSEED